MLEYFGFYAPAPEGPEADANPAMAEPAPDEPERELVVARAARLADRRRHTPSAAPAGPAWDSGPPRER